MTQAATLEGYQVPRLVITVLPMLRLAGHTFLAFTESDIAFSSQTEVRLIMGETAGINFISDN